MNSDTYTMEKYYKTKDIAEMLGVESVTVRKYSQSLEQFGYTFEKQKDRRVYKTSDLALLQQLKYMKERTGMSLNKTAEIVVMKHSEQKSDQATNTVSPISQEQQENGNLMQYDKQYINRSISLIIEQNERILSELEREKKEKEELHEEILKLHEKLNKQHEEQTERIDTFNQRFEQVMEEKKGKESIWKKIFGRN
ncbi:MerR family transcriptional regulator [Virgibacillus salexigens]|uniref:MerR family transcriptional regulator n=1 Tax=Virgibacillus massiliensis TaxID=1462526 RepID=UPI00136E926F|nr:MerR family transcriptional regulator [Virgibacillus massiliensis]MYL43993.1 MerR family transcriptional regulator [Virgibacillus massiliensis]